MKSAKYLLENHVSYDFKLETESYQKQRLMQRTKRAHSH